LKFAIVVIMTKSRTTMKNGASASSQGANDSADLIQVGQNASLMMNKWFEGQLSERNAPSADDLKGKFLLTQFDKKRSYLKRRSL